MLFTGKDLIKKATTLVIPAENWANKDLIHEDRMSGISKKEILKNVESTKLQAQIGQNRKLEICR